VTGPRFELDHVFVAVSRGAPQIEALRAAGFAEGPPNTHPGQGTACRRVFFDNAYLELIWLEDEAEASAPAVERTGLARRLACEPGVSRLGVGLRAAGREEATLPVRTWSYSPPFLPTGVAIEVGASSRELHEPLLFFVPGPPGWTRLGGPHPNGAERVTEVTLGLPGHEPASEELAWLEASGLARIERTDAEVVTVVLDHGRRGQRLSCAPEMPLCLCW